MAIPTNGPGPTTPGHQVPPDAIGPEPGLRSPGRAASEEGPPARARRPGSALGARIATARRAVRRRPVVLMYHRVARDPVEPFGLAVSAARFDDQLRWLARRCRVLTLHDLARRVTQGDLPDDAVAITFDDGYADNALVAAPLLQRHGVPATVFVTTEPVLRAEEFWWDDLERIVQGAGEGTLVVHVDGRAVEVAVRGAPSPWPARARAATGRHHAFLELRRALRPLAGDARRAALAELRAQAGVAREPRPTHRPMAVDEVRALAEGGLVEVGAHTATHPLLTRRSRSEQVDEIQCCLDECRRWGLDPRSFAYPHGDHDDTTVAVVRELGLDVACTTVARAVTCGDDPLRLPRLHVGDWSAARLAMAMRLLP